MGMIEIPDPPGYRVVGYGAPKAGQPYLTYDRDVYFASKDRENEYRILLEPVEVWRDATIDDLHRVPLRCRVLYDDAWANKTLVGFQHCGHEVLWVMSNGLRYSKCQVLEEPCEPNK